MAWRTRKILKLIFVVVLFLSSFMVVPCLAIEPDKILALSLEAQFQVNTDGIKETRIYRGGKTYIVRARIVYQEPDFSYVLYLAPPEIKGKRILDDGKLRIDYVLGVDKFKVSFSLNSLPAKQRKRGNLNLIFANYTISQLPDEYIAGRETYLISLTYQYSGNPSLKIWIDKETFLCLKRERYNSEGELIFSSTFTEIHFDKIISEDELNGIPESVRNKKLLPRHIIYNLQKLREKSRFPLSFPKYLPKGYNFQEATLLNGGKRVALIYSNGLQTIVFSQSLPVNVRMKSRADIPLKEALEQLHPLAKIKFWTERGKTFVFIGDISEEELTKIMESIE